MNGKGIGFDGPPPLRAEGVRQHAGDLQAAGLRFGIVAARFNASLTRQLVESAIECLRAQGAAAGDIEVAWVPGAYEVPFVVETLAARGGFDALVAVGCVIQGETPHANSLAEIARRHRVPVIDGVIAANTEEQAVLRCRPGREGRGWYAASAAIEMARLLRRLGGRP
jgi:6,7-dimethyl-8-ribityllumazine synthase